MDKVELQYVIVARRCYLPSICFIASAIGTHKTLMCYSGCRWAKHVCFVFPAHETNIKLEMNNNSSNENPCICYFPAHENNNPAHETETNLEMENNSSNENSFYLLPGS